MDEHELLHRIEWAAEERATELDLRDRGLTSLPPEIGQLRSLMGLYLGNAGPASFPGTLRQVMTERLNGSELRDLCFDLGVDDENLGGVDKRDKVRELIAYVRRRDRVGDLLAAGKRLYPDIPWDEMIVLE